MSRDGNSYWLWLAALLAASAPILPAQDRDRRARIDVQNYVIEGEINPRTESLAASAQVTFVPLEDRTTSVAFELNNALNVSRVVDSSGRQVPSSRSAQDYTVRLNFLEALQKDKPVTVTFTYDGRLSGAEESPVYGIKFASIKSDFGYLMYPARWFPVNDYTADRYTADIKMAVPAGFRLLGSGIDRSENAGEKTIYSFRYTQPGFPGSLALVQGNPVKVSSQGITTDVYFRSAAAQARPYGEETGKVMTYLTSVFGLAPQANITIVETERGAPNGYAAPGLLFLSPGGIGSKPNPRLLANQLSRQWYGLMVSPLNRNHIWITNGVARYSEALYLEHLNGPSSLEADMRDIYVEALTVDQPPLSQSARLEDYSPEFVAATGGKGAAVLHMLRYVIGDGNFQSVLKAVTEQFANKGIRTDDFRAIAEKVSGQNLQYFFIQWIESTGAPEFKLEYTVFRTQKGFRVMGKVAQDLDTFRMPVELKIETEGNPEEKKIDVVGVSSEFVVDTFGKPRRLEMDPNNRVLRFSNKMRVSVAIRRGEQFAEVGEYGEALKEYQKALDVNRTSSLAHYRVAEVFFLQNNYQSAANEFRETLSGDIEPKWTEVWAHINLGKIFDITGQRERAVNEYNLALRTKDNTQGATEEAAKYAKEPYQRPRSNN